MRAIILGIVISLALISCNKKAVEKEELVPIDSLAYQERSSGNITFPVSMTVSESELFVADATDSVFVYDLNNGNYLRSFGGTGKGPGKFSAINGMKFLPWKKTLLLSEMGNGRLQETSIDGENIATYSCLLAKSVMYKGKEIYFSNLFYESNTRAGIYKLMPDGTAKLVFSPLEWMKNNNVTGVDNLVDLVGDKFVCVMQSYLTKKILIADFNGKITTIDADPLNQPEKVIFGDAVTYKDGFLIPCLYYDQKLEKLQEIRQQAKHLFAYYSSNGKLMKTFKVSDKYKVVLVGNAWILKEKTIYIPDAVTGIIYLFKID